MHWTLRKLVHPPKDHSELYESGRSEVPVRPSDELEHHSDNQHRFSQLSRSSRRPSRPSPAMDSTANEPRFNGGSRSPIHGVHPSAATPSTVTSRSFRNSDNPRRSSSSASSSSSLEYESKVPVAMAGRSRNTNGTPELDPRTPAEAGNNFPGTNPRPGHSFL